ncbi:MAG TPA: DMT family transporter [Gemmatimonadales bacterium]|nr:DMT family transporter [Gemmatimonadales bacterium]
MTRTRALPRLKLVAAALLFSTGGAAIKATTLTGWQVACFRSGVAALAVFLLAREARRGWSWRAALVGVAYAATLILFVTANKLTTSANTIFLQATAPLYMVVLSPWLLGERLRREDLIVMAAVAVGLALVLAGHDAPVATAPDPARGNVLAALSGLTWALTVCGLRWVGDEARGGSAVPSVVLGNAIAFLAALPFALPLGASRTVDWAVIAYLGIFQIGVAYLLVSSGLRQVTAIEASILLLVEPALNPFFAWLVHGEKPSAFAMAGGLIILGATTLRTWIDARSPVAEPVGAAP